MSYSVKHFDPKRALQIIAYTISAQVARLATLPNDFSIKVPTKWYVTSLEPSWVQQNFFKDLTLRNITGHLGPKQFRSICHFSPQQFRPTSMRPIKLHHANAPVN